MGGMGTVAWGKKRSGVGRYGLGGTGTWRGLSVDNHVQRPHHRQPCTESPWYTLSPRYGPVFPTGAAASRASADPACAVIADLGNYAVAKTGQARRCVDTAGPQHPAFRSGVYTGYNIAGAWLGRSAGSSVAV